MLDVLLRPKLEHCFVASIAGKLARIGVRPNMVTAVAVILGVLSAVSIVLGHPLAAVILLWSSGYLDMLDGSLARLSSSTPVGAVLDIMADRMVEASIIIALFIVQPNHGLICMGMLASVLICVTSFLVVGIFSENQSAKSFHYSPGLMERAEAFICFSCMILFSQYFVPLGISFIVLVLLTACIRVFEFVRAFAHGA